MDRVFKKQLEKFGIEQTRVVEGNTEKKRQDESIETMQDVARSIMGTIQGRQWIYNKLLGYGIFESPFVAGKPDVSAFISGLQHAGQLLRAEVELVAPAEFYLMMQEASARANQIKN